MRIKQLNVYEEQYKWMREHERPDHIVCDAKGNMVQAIYDSPLKQWEGLMRPDGMVNVPDMDYYNSLTSVADIERAIDEIF